MLTVLHIITGLAVGGAEQALYNLLAGGLGSVDEHVVLSLRDEGAYGPRIRALGVPVYALNMRRGMPGPGVLFKLRRLTRRLRPDVIQGWMYHGNLAAWLAQRFATEKPALAWGVHHSLYDLSKERPLTRLVIRANCWLSNAPAAVIYVSRFSRTQHENIGFCAKNSQVITIGFDLESYRPDEADGQDVRVSLGIPESAVVVGHVARLHPLKDHPRFVRVASRIAKIRPDTYFLLIGRDVDTAATGLSEVASGATRQSFRWIGERTDIPRLMRAMNVFCQSSWSEAFPNVLGEAMATEVPCVATNVGDTAYIISETGILVAPNDDEALFNGLIAMIDCSSAARCELGYAARKRIAANFGLSAVIEQYKTLYRRLS